MKLLADWTTGVATDFYTSGAYMNVMDGSDPDLSYCAYSISVANYKARKVIIQFTGVEGATYYYKVLGVSGSVAYNLASGSSTVLAFPASGFTPPLSTKRVWIEVTLPTWAGASSGKLIVMMKSDNAADTARQVSCVLYENEITDTNGRVDVGTILGEAPLSENTIAQVVDAELKANHGDGIWGADVVAPSRT
jgi:hypothetical protein